MFQYNILYIRNKFSRCVFSKIYKSVSVVLIHYLLPENENESHQKNTLLTENNNLSISKLRNVKRKC